MVRDTGRVVVRWCTACSQDHGGGGCGEPHEDPPAKDSHTEAAEQAYFLQELFQVADRNPRVRVIPIRKAHLGRLSADDIEAASRGLPEKDILICGPPVMIGNLTGQLRARGIPRARIHYEDFSFLSRATKP
jgi:ferredoxin-NADP reductase